MRAMICIFFAYSFLYFFLIFRPHSPKAYLILGVLFELLNFVMVIAGLLGFAVLKSASCKSWYGNIVMVNSAIGVIIGTAEVVGHAICFYAYKENGTLPFFNKYTQNNEEVEL